MKIPIAQLEPGQNALKWSSEKPDQLKAFYDRQVEAGYSLKGPIRVELDVTKLDPDYYLRGQIHYTIELPCAQCAEPVAVSVIGPFHLSLLRTDKIKSAEKLSEETEELDIVCFSGPEFNMSELLQEQFVLHIPTRAECKTPACLERSRLLMDKIHTEVDHWKDKENPFAVLNKLKNKK